MTIAAQRTRSLVAAIIGLAAACTQAAATSKDVTMLRCEGDAVNQALDPLDVKEPIDLQDIKINLEPAAKLFTIISGVGPSRRRFEITLDTPLLLGLRSIDPETNGGVGSVNRESGAVRINIPVDATGIRVASYTLQCRPIIPLF